MASNKHGYAGLWRRYLLKRGFFYVTRTKTFNLRHDDYSIWARPHPVQPGVVMTLNESAGKTELPFTDFNDCDMWLDRVKIRYNDQAESIAALVGRRGGGC